MAIYSDVNYLNTARGAKIEDVDSVYQAVYTLLSTKVGQRVFRPTYGSYLENYLFEPCDEISAESIRYDILTTLEQEPRIQINKSRTSVTPVPEKQMFYINIVFTVLGFSDTERTMELTLKTKNRTDV